MPAAAPIIGQIAVNLAIGAVAIGVESLLKPKSAVATQRQVTSRGMSFDVVVGEQVPVSAIYGRGRTGGFLTFAQEYGTNNEFAKFVFVNGKGRYDSFDSLLVDEKVRTLSGSNADVDGKVIDDFTVSGTPHLWIKTYDGSPGQAADAGLIAAAPTRWTVDHTATATPYSIITMRQNPDLFGSVLPRFGFVWKGLRQYDWRFDDTMPGGAGDQRWADPSTWAWSENPAVIKYNFRRGLWLNGVRVLGMGFSQYAQDLAYYTAAANLSDELVNYADTDVDIARYAFGREISDDEQHLDVLQELDQAMCGSSFDRGGADAPLPAAQMVSAMTLEDKHRVLGAPVAKDLYGTVSSKKTAYHGSFISAADGWTPMPYGQRASSELETLIGGRKSQPFDQPYESSIERAQARAEIMLRKNLFPARRTETFGPRSNVLEVGDPITRIMDDWGTMLGVIEELTPNADRTQNIITWRQWDNTIVPDTTAGFLQPTPAGGTLPVAADRTIVVSGLSVSAVNRSSGGAELPYLRASWTTITDPGVDQVLIRYWPTSGTEAIDGENVYASARLQSTKVWGPVTPDTEYTGYAIPIRKDGRTTVATSLFTVTSGDLTTPADVADGSVTLAKLNQELRNAHGLVTDPSIGGSIPAQLLALEQLSAQLAEALMAVADTAKQRLDLLDVHRDGAAAAIIRNDQAIINETEARAAALTEVVAQFGAALADGYLRLEAVANTTTAEVSISAKVKAAIGAALSQAAWLLKASVSEDGDEALFAVYGKLHVLVPGGDGTFIPAIDTLEDGRVKFLGTIIPRVDGGDGVSYIDTTNGIDIFSQSTP